jgi:hypothetical protein
MEFAPIFCAMVENYFIYRYRSKRAVYCWGIPDSGKTRIAQFLDKIFIVVNLNVSDENFSIEDDEVKFWANPYQPQMIIMDEGNVY